VHETPPCSGQDSALIVLGDLARVSWFSLRQVAVTVVSIESGTAEGKQTCQSGGVKFLGVEPNRESTEGTFARYAGSVLPKAAASLSP
jgi:hypothetical protein